MFLLPGVPIKGEDALPPPIALTLAWDEPESQPEVFIPQKYAVVWRVNHGAEQTNYVLKSDCSNGVGRLVFGDCQPNATYTFKVLTVCTLAKAPSVETNSDFSDPLVYRTGSKVKPDANPPFLHVDYAPEFSWTNEITLSGFVFDTSQIFLSVTGSAVMTGLSWQGAGGNWSSTLRLTDPLTNAITVTARDLFGFSASTNLTIYNMLGSTNEYGYTAGEMMLAGALDTNAFYDPSEYKATVALFVNDAKSKEHASGYYAIRSFQEDSASNLANLTFLAKPGTWFTLQKSDLPALTWETIGLGYAEQAGLAQIRTLSPNTNAWIYRVNPDLSDLAYLSPAEMESVTQSFFAARLDSTNELALENVTGDLLFLCYIPPNTRSSAIHLTGANGNPELYVKKGLPVTDASIFEYREITPDMTNKTVRLTASGPFDEVPSGAWFIMAGNSSGEPVSYRLSATLEEAPFVLEGTILDAPQQIQLRWKSKSSRTYGIEAARIFAATTWRGITNGIPSQGASTQVQIPITGPRQYFRVVEERTP